MLFYILLINRKTVSRSHDPFRPPFSKLEEYLDNLRMHLDIGLSLLSELQQLRKNFWKNHRDHVHNQDKPAGSQEQTQSERRSSDHRKHSANANNVKGPNHLSQIKDRYDTPESHLGQQHPQDSHVMGSENNHTDKECKYEICCRSDKNEPKQQKKYSQQPQEEITEALCSPSNGLRRTCSALWDRSSEDSSVLWMLVWSIQPSFWGRKTNTPHICAFHPVSQYCYYIN